MEQAVSAAGQNDTAVEIELGIGITIATIF